MRKMAFVIEHRRARKPARAQFVVKINVLRIIGKIIQPAYNVARLIFHGICQTDELDVVFPYEVRVQVARGIGGKGKFVFHNSPKKT